MPLDSLSVPMSLLLLLGQEAHPGAGPRSLLCGEAHPGSQTEKPQGVSFVSCKACTTEDGPLISRSLLGESILFGLLNGKIYARH